MSIGSLSPIQTCYRGYRFRSRLEARWAVFFDACGVKWEYEPGGFVLSNGVCYLPDFLLHDVVMWDRESRYVGDLYVEVKGKLEDEDRAKLDRFGLDGGHLYVVGNLYGCYSLDDVDERVLNFGLGGDLTQAEYYNGRYIRNGSQFLDTYFGVDEDGYFGLFDHKGVGRRDDDATWRAILEARKARFEHGEKPVVHSCCASSGQASKQSKKQYKENDENAVESVEKTQEEIQEEIAEKERKDLLKLIIEHGRENDKKGVRGNIGLVARSVDSIDRIQVKSYSLINACGGNPLYKNNWGKFLRYIFEADLDLNPADYVVYGFLFRHSNLQRLVLYDGQRKPIEKETGYYIGCTLDTMLKGLHLTKRTLLKSLSQLEAVGLISIPYRATRQDRKGSCYQIRLDFYRESEWLNYVGLPKLKKAAMTKGIKIKDRWGWFDNLYGTMGDCGILKQQKVSSTSAYILLLVFVLLEWAQIKQDEKILTGWYAVIDKKQIRERLGFTTERINRALSRLEELGLINLCERVKRNILLVSI